MPAKEIPHVNPMKNRGNRENRGKTGERPGKDRGKTTLTEYYSLKVVYYSDRVAIYMDVIRPPFLS